MHCRSVLGTLLLLVVSSLACNDVVSGRGDGGLAADHAGREPDSSADSASGAACGDGVRNGAEACDGQDLGGRICTTEGFGGGELRCHADCTLDTSGCSRCGDGVLSSGEACDGASLGGRTCQGEGFSSGAVACTATCQLDLSGCQIATCGNGKLDAAEQCEGSDLGGKTCKLVGFDGGTLACNSNCSFNTAGCFRCGDGVRNGTEQCDGTQLGGKTCQSQGFAGGALGCTATCTLHTAACFKCGDGVRNGTEPCDGTQLGGATCQSLGFASGTLACTAACAFNTTACKKAPDAGKADAGKADAGKKDGSSPVVCTKKAGTGAPYATIQAAVNAAVPGDVICVVAGTYPLSSPISIKTKGTAAAPVEIRAEGNVTLTDVSKKLGLWSGMFQVDGASYVALRGFHLVDLSWFGVRIASSDHITVDGCQTLRSPASGIYVEQSTYVTVSNNDVGSCCLAGSSVKDSAGQIVGSQECISIVESSHFDVGYNTVHDSPTAETGGEGIDAKSGVKTGRIHHNRVYNLVRLGIYVDAYATDSDDVEIDSNEVYQTYAGIVIASEMGGKVTNVRIHDNILHHNGADWAPPSPFYAWKESVGINIAQYGGNGLRRYISIYNNTIVANTWQGKGVGIRIETSNAADVVVRNNLIAGHTDGLVAAAASSVTETANNLVYPFATSPGEIEGSAAIHKDPLFVNETARNYHLQAGSPAINQGKAGPPVATVDAEGKPRLVGAAVDIGAYEHAP